MLSRVSWFKGIRQRPVTTADKPGNSADGRPNQALLPSNASAEREQEEHMHLEHTIKTRVTRAMLVAFALTAAIGSGSAATPAIASTHDNWGATAPATHAGAAAIRLDAGDAGKMRSVVASGRARTTKNSSVPNGEPKNQPPFTRLVA
jgi:hypothetical protein